MVEGRGVHDLLSYEKHVSLILQNIIPVTLTKWQSFVNIFILVLKNSILPEQSAVESAVVSVCLACRNKIPHTGDFHDRHFSSHNFGG